MDIAFLQQGFDGDIVNRLKADEETSNSLRVGILLTKRSITEWRPQWMAES